MKLNNTSYIQEIVQFSPELYGYIQQSAKKYGVPVGEYLRMLAFEDVHRHSSSMIESFDEETIESVGRALQQVENGTTTTINPDNDKELDTILGISA